LEIKTVIERMNGKNEFLLQRSSVIAEEAEKHPEHSRCDTAHSFPLVRNDRIVRVYRGTIG
jgi:hypothetical protein